MSAPALEELVRDYRLFFKWTLSHYTYDENLANDIVQDAFVKILKLPYLRPSTARTLMCTIIRNTYLDYCRRQKITPRMTCSDFDLVHPKPLPDMAIYHELCDAVKQTLSEMLPEQAQIFKALCDDNTITPTQLAKKYNIPPATVRWRLYAARKKLRISLAHYR